MTRRSSPDARLPHGRELARSLRRFYRRVAQEQQARIARGWRSSDLSHWQLSLESLVQPFFMEFALQGSASMRRQKSNPRVIRSLAQQAEDAARRFATETLGTAMGKLADIFGRGGGSLAEMADSVKAWLTAPARTEAQAEYEASAAYHAGQTTTARLLGSTRKQWVADANACKKCRAIAGKVVPIDGIFAIDGSGPYGLIKAPPYHVRCACKLRMLP